MEDNFPHASAQEVAQKVDEAVNRFEDANLPTITIKVPENVASDPGAMFEQVASLTKSREKAGFKFWIVEYDQSLTVETLRTGRALSVTIEELVEEGKAQWVTPPVGYSLPAIERRYGDQLISADIIRDRKKLKLIFWQIDIADTYAARVLIAAQP